MSTSPQVQRLALRYRIGDMTLHELSEAAAELIVNGATSQALERLAWGRASGPEEAQALVDAAVDESGSGSDVQTAVRSFVRDVAREILRGDITPYDGARRIWAAALLLPDEHAYDPLIYAASEYDDRPGDRRFLDEAIVTASHNFAR